MGINQGVQTLTGAVTPTTPTNSTPAQFDKRELFLVAEPNYINNPQRSNQNVIIFHRT